MRRRRARAEQAAHHPSPRRASAPSARRSDSSAREKALILARVASRRPPGESPRAENRARGPPPRSRRAGRATPRARAPLPRHHGCPQIEPRGDRHENANFFRTNNSAPGLLTRLTLLDVRGDRVGRTTTSPPLPFPPPSFHLPRLADAAAAVIFSFSANLALACAAVSCGSVLIPSNFTASGPPLTDAPSSATPTTTRCSPRSAANRSPTNHFAH